MYKRSPARPCRPLGSDAGTENGITYASEAVKYLTGHVGLQVASFLEFSFL